MGIVRLVVLGVLFYIAWLLLKGIMGAAKKSTEERREKKGATSAKVEDVLVEDPVCHTLVPKSQSIRLRKDGKTYYFCSDTCCDKFLETPREKE